MAVDQVREVWEGRGGTVDRSGVRSYTRVFWVRTDDNDDGADIVAEGVDPSTSLAVPDLGDPFSTGDPDAVAIRISPRQKSETPKLWLVTVEYSSDTGSQTGNAVEDEDPIQRAPVESIGFSRVTVPMEKDSAGVAVVNSAEDLFDPLPEVERSFPVLTIRRNELGFAYSDATDFVDTINDAPFRGAAAGLARMQDISATSRFENGVAYFEVTYQIAFRREGWDIQVLDRGYRELVGGAHKVIKVRSEDSSGNLLAEEVPSQPPLLDGSGAQLAVGGTPVFLTFSPYPSKNWGPLGL